MCVCVCLKLGSIIIIIQLNRSIVHDIEHEKFFMRNLIVVFIFVKPHLLTLFGAP